MVRVQRRDIRTFAALRPGVRRSCNGAKNGCGVDKCWATVGRPVKMSISQEPVRRCPVRCRAESAAIRGFDADIDLRASDWRRVCHGQSRVRR